MTVNTEKLPYDFDLLFDIKEAKKQIKETEHLAQIELALSLIE